MLKRSAVLAFVIPILVIRTISAQGINTQANKDDWEEINFEFNSSVLVDGFPSLLRIAELLQMNPGYKVKIEGHTDRIGSNPYNDKLGLARATAVRDFLVKYGARAAQIEVSSRGKTELKYGQGKPGIARTDEQRWMDRRVALTVTDAQGRTVGAGGAREAIQALPGGGVSQDCCNEILHRLDKLDALEKMLKDLADQNAALRDQLAGLRQAQDALRDQLAGLRQPPPPPPAPPAAPAPSAAEVAKAVNDEHERRNPKFELLGLNAGGTGNGDATATAKGRYFSAFGEHYAVQSEGEYFYSRGQREGQFDLGLVDRVGRFQAGLFSSFKHVNLTGDQTGGTLGEGAATLEYLFSWGKIGAFGTKAFLDDALVNSTPFVNSSGVLLPDFVQQRYLRVVDQGGLSATGPLFGKNYFEGNLGYLRSTTAGDRVGGTLRLIFPVSNNIAFTLEGGINETLLGAGNTGRVVAGVQFGNFMRPRDLLASNHATPVQIPRVRYEILTRTLRVGHLPPVADAGPNQTLQGPATVTLNGSNSFSPDGDKLTYQWTQQSGAPVTLSAPTSAATTFAGAAGQVYTFQLTVRDAVGAQGTARVTITMTTAPPPQILFFTALPAAIQAGQSSTLAWQVINADTITISTIGGVVPTGSVQVTPATTTIYQITATKGSITVTASAAVTILPPPATTGPGGVKIVSYSQQVLSDGNTQLYCITENAVSIMLNGRTFPFTTEAVLEVNPPVPTQYPCVATGADGTVVSQTLTVQ
ncbi:MAG TPA: OmpA family protein [Bryobacteraceae bacterium]|nr:OmpA family protein [Bryobacteraceae bacterium]